MGSPQPADSVAVEGRSGLNRLSGNADQGRAGFDAGAQADIIRGREVCCADVHARAMRREISRIRIGGGTI